MRRLAGQTRKTIKLSDSLHHELAGYVLAAGAAGVSVLALAPASEGQIVYTPTHERIGRNGTMLIDLNHDGIADLKIQEVPWTYGTNHYPGNSLKAITRPGSGIRKSPYHGSLYAAAMLRGQDIGPSSPFRSGPEVMLRAIDPFGTYYFGSWGDAGQFLGVRFQINGTTHYGWARLNVIILNPKHGIEALLTGYAYETQPDTPIRAGDTGSTDAKDENSDSTSELFYSPKAEAEGKATTLGALALGTLRRAQ
jgi:hypothetical protein